MADTAQSQTLNDIVSELAELEDPKTRAVNERHGDDHGVKLSAIRAIAKRLKTQPDLAVQLWQTGATAPRLLSLLITRPRALASDDVDRMLREARVPKVHDWLVNYIAAKHPDAESLRAIWFEDADPIVASAGWDLTAKKVVTSPEGLDLNALLNTIESEMVHAEERLQWAMNTCLAQIGITQPEHRQRAVAIGERLGVLKDYPTPPNCTSPYAPIWIAEMVSRQSAAATKSG